MTNAARHAPLGPVSTDSAVLLLVDQQEGLFGQIHEAGQKRASLLALARSARLLGSDALDGEPRTRDHPRHCCCPAGHQT